MSSTRTLTAPGPITGAASAATDKWAMPPTPGRRSPRADSQEPVGEATAVLLAVLIPAYRPDARLAELTADLRRELPGCTVLVVDDGSGPEYSPVFEAARHQGAIVIGYEGNRGKGHALRTGLAHAARLRPGADVVCADADGQHRPADIAAVATRVRRTRRMALGVRRFTGSVPLRSRIGNTATALLFRGATGWALGDTQTGLRGYPAGAFNWLQSVPGDRYEYELSALLRARELGMTVEEVEITTVYEPGNPSSHFRPIADSARIYTPLLRFIAASMSCFAIDWAAVMALFAMTGNLLVATVGARLVSGSANFFINRRVFRAAPGTVHRTAARYLLLAVTLLVGSYLALRILTGFGIPLGVAKILGDGAVYVASYLAQRRLVFRDSA
ncbi:bifunctional glycosyltransferase family 2/GtrA family protein [Actinomyces gaoshouyii]|uniref:bifunctional glycosyltransferase family 2/GtrA family protein n=1 Tax=Actinomyces gaoshouyii TaxID=1960083 RepID=UPI0009C061F3|nr:bifunctional glycosyltransferase family 2/GtrA family protein [Actinomyces gaoshouyii]ARD42569.1 dolichyl-phosphate beta-D-mannosyltransferase [Actinomyces gaoshouyii]